MNKDKQVEVYNIIPGNVRSCIEVLDLENEGDEETEDVNVYNMISDDIRSRIEPVDLEDE